MDLNFGEHGEGGSTKLLSVKVNPHESSCISHYLWEHVRIH